MKKLSALFFISALAFGLGGCQSLGGADNDWDKEGTVTVKLNDNLPDQSVVELVSVEEPAAQNNTAAVSANEASTQTAPAPAAEQEDKYKPLPEGPSPDAPYERSQQLQYERKLKYSNFAPFLYDGKFYAYYSIASKVKGPDEDGFYVMEFKNGPKEGQQIKTKDVIIKTRPARTEELKKGLVVLVNHWDPLKENSETKVDMWRRGVVYDTDQLPAKGVVMIEFPFDKDDFLSTKETYRATSLRVIEEPRQQDIRTFLD